MASVFHFVSRQSCRRKHLLGNSAGRDRHEQSSCPRCCHSLSRQWRCRLCAADQGSSGALAAERRIGLALRKGLQPIGSMSHNLTCGALILAGYIGSDMLSDAVRTCWEKCEDKKGVVLPALWAAFRCTGEQAGALIGPMLATILELENDPTGQSYSHRDHVLQQDRMVLSPRIHKTSA